jgi:hypothetical protein
MCKKTEIPACATLADCNSCTCLKNNFGFNSSTEEVRVFYDIVLPHLAPGVRSMLKQDGEMLDLMFCLGNNSAGVVLEVSKLLLSEIDRRRL